MRLSQKQLMVFITFVVLAGLFYSDAKTYAQPSRQTSPEIGRCIFIIKPQLHEGSVRLFNQVADILDKKRTREMTMLADKFRGIAKGGHGSGFLFVDANGNNYVITNRHVVEEASSVNIVLRDGSGYTSAPIVYIDSRADLAVIQFPQNYQPYKIGLPISATDALELTEIYAAGYPGIAGQPEWQIAHGNITNKSVIIDKASYIQHSAPIDPGNSGGPLLMRKGSGYVVIGVNTLTLKSAQNRNFAVPSEEITRVIREAQKISRMEDSEKMRALENACRELSDEMNSQAPDLKRMEDFISPQMVATSGYACFNDTIKGKGDIQDAFIEGFVEDPLRTMRLAILVSMKKDLYSRSNGGRVFFDHINSSDISKIGNPQQNIRTLFRCGTASQPEIVWMFEYGKWRIVDLIGLKLEATKSENIECKTIRNDELNILFGKCSEKYTRKDDKINCLASLIVEFCKKINGGENNCSKECVNAILEQMKQ